MGIRCGVRSCLLKATDKGVIMATQYKLVKRSFFSRIFNDFHRTHDKVIDEAATLRDDIREARAKHYKSWRPQDTLYR